MYHEVLEYPNYEERSETILWLLKGFFKFEFELSNLKSLAHRTSGYLFGDLEELIRRVHR